MQLTTEQLAVVESPLICKLFYEGPAGTGKSTAGVNRLTHLIQSGVPGRRILLLFPQRNLGAIYQKTYQDHSQSGLSPPILATYGGLARRILHLFWPAITQTYPRLQPNLQPTFLTLESSLYFLSKVVEPLITEKGYFSTIVIQRNRLYSQLLDNLNKSAIHKFPHTDIAERLISAWIGDPVQEGIYQQAQEAASQFRKYCYQNNLLDYSLQIELFAKSFEDLPLINDYLANQFDHLIYDNCEEDVPVSHDLVRKLANHLDSYLIIYDHDAGYRNFLGASPSSAHELSKICTEKHSSGPILTASSELQVLNSRISDELSGAQAGDPNPPDSIKTALSIHYQPSYPELTDWIAKQTHSLIESGVKPNQIAILSPFLSDSLRFLLVQSLSKYSISAASHRPSRALRDEPVTLALLTLAALSHPDWNIHPSTYDLALSFVQIIKGLDLTRAYLLAENARKANSRSIIPLAAFEDLPDQYQDRITFFSGSLYQYLVDWLNEYANGPVIPLDHFFNHLFGDVLSIIGYGFHNDLAKARTTSQIIESIKDFRGSSAKVLGLSHLDTGREYYAMVKSGILANQHISSWTDISDDELLISPAYTFLLHNRPVDYQFWIDIGSQGWYERIYQPLTNPHILQVDWPLGKAWTDKDEQLQNINALNCLVTGLIRRARKSIFGCLTEVDERGFEQKGTLLLTLNKIIQNDHSVYSSRGEYTA